MQRLRGRGSQLLRDEIMKAALVLFRLLRSISNYGEVLWPTSIS
jgi:hypothetical protein